MSYSGGGDLDTITFSDECFASFVSLGPRGEVEAEAYVPRGQKQNAPKATRTAEVLTETLYYADAETNTKYKKKEVEVTPYLLLSLYRYKLKSTLTLMPLGRMTTKVTMMRMSV